MADAPAERHVVWVGSYTADLGGTGVGVSRLVLERSAGTIIDGTLFRCNSPAFVAAARAGGPGYAVEERTGLLRTLMVGSAGELECVDARFVGRQPCHVAIDPAGRFLVVSDWHAGGVTFVHLDEGGVPRMGGVVRFPGGGHGSRAHAALVLDDAMIVTTDPGLDRLRVWSVNDAGAVAARGDVDLPTGCRPRHLTQDAQGRVHVLTEQSSEVLTLEPSRRHGLAVIASSPVRANPSPADSPSSITSTIVAGETILHAAVRGSNVLVSLRSNAQGALTIIGETPTGGDEPRDHCLVGDRLFVANRRTNTVGVFDLKQGIPKHAFSIPAGTPASVAAFIP
ncbi:lactonase family protein [Leifsonia sp. NPDC058194]|uniref:lactonase family protein n=1 Tax=Leifsonia sp. NPDC058194 TaxID=3346374 RepID=UPI0036DB6A32